VVPLNAVIVEVTRSGGPGGQHANTSDTAVRVRIETSAIPLTEEERQRLAGRVIQARSSKHRSQQRNRVEATQTALARLDEALRVEPTRRATRPTLAATARRLADKRRRSERKNQRRSVDLE
jgi:ribosome-associated protein